MVGLGDGSNNFAELLSLKILLIFAAEKGCITLNVYGDLMNVINWIKGIQTCRNIRLETILFSIRDVIETYNTFNCQHVYGENKRLADRVAKAGLQMEVGSWKIRESLDGFVHEYYHRCFTKGDDL